MTQTRDNSILSEEQGAGYLRAVGLRPTQQRLALAGLLFSGEDRHVTAESLYEEATAQGVKVSLATVYNTLNQFKDAGLLREVIVHSGKSYFDTKTEAHHHLYDEDSGEIEDVHLQVDEQEVRRKVQVPEGKQISGVDIVVRLRTDRG
ncbi:MAG: transcriptional repressor [Halorhodospira halophila]|uniref:iron response transcriptional regulator IrrA n=1 Tax=Halorhodospira TaxID=85108 RepID=UPI0019122342|nr:MULTISPECIES: Fur family transcriptional regulator [Halorhodospira]MBK5935951.1 transcriptional repressor [Halorhodospira halophila]MBK5943297.1 transcriptional repressor [Halorhodospira halophila]MCC3751924.1 transcriptional repressor [Halorhodospira halophila]MCG5526820.1 transcriptional repressor [Halorhodospira halophila]MCG5533328.1 transcriptional repressor [Halorhodospira sp. 9621]